MSKLMDIHVLNAINDLLAAKKLEEAATQFAKLIKSSTNSDQQSAASLSLDFGTLGGLFQIDRTLSTLNRTIFWEQVEKNLKGSTPNLPYIIKLFMEEAMKSLPGLNDPYRISQLQSLFNKNRSLSGLQYLIGRALGVEGIDTENPEKLRKSLLIFTQLSVLTIPSQYEQKPTVFTRERINTLMNYLSLLDLKQALEILDEQFNDGWLSEAGNIRDHLITRRESLRDAVALKVKTEKSLIELKDNIEKSLKESSSEYQVKHIEILIVFFALIALVTGVLHVMPAKKTSFDTFGFMIGLSLSLIGFMGISLVFLATNIKQMLTRGILGVLALLILYCTPQLLRPNEEDKNLVTTYAENNKSDKFNETLSKPIPLFQKITTCSDSLYQAIVFLV